MYANSSSSKYLRILLFGDIGVGKSSMLLKAPHPIHHDSLDRGGSVSIRRGIQEGWIISDTRWEEEDPRRPSVLKNLEATFDKRVAEGYFNYFSTYCIDGLTMLQEAGMNVILTDRRRMDLIPSAGKGQENDYVAMQKKIEPLLRKILNLPCHVIMTAHLDRVTDEANPNKDYIGPKVSGGLLPRLTGICDEVWCIMLRPASTPGATGMERVILTQPNGMYRCRSRLAALGNIQTFEWPDFKALLKKGGYDDSDKDIPWLNK